MTEDMQSTNEDTEPKSEGVQSKAEPPRVRLGPKAMIEFGDVRDRQSALEDLIERSQMLEMELGRVRRKLSERSRFEEVFSQMIRVLSSLQDSQIASRELTQARYRRLDQLHLRTRALMGVRLSEGSEREKVFAAMHRQSITLQAHIDTLDLKEAQIANAQKNETERMQQLLREAGSFDQSMEKQLEMPDLEPGGIER